MVVSLPCEQATLKLAQVLRHLCIQTDMSSLIVLSTLLKCPSSFQNSNYESFQLQIYSNNGLGSAL